MVRSCTDGYSIQNTGNHFHAVDHVILLKEFQHKVKTIT